VTEQTRVGEIYVDDVLVTDVFTLPEHKVQAHQIAYGIMVALARDYTAPRYVKVQVPGKAYPDLWTNYQYLFFVRIGDVITETYASGELVDDRDLTGRTGENLAIMIRRGFQRATAKGE
jgi:hypothetical protein